MRKSIYPKTPLLYFAHPQNTYGTNLEMLCILYLQEYFSGQVSIVNPSEDIHQDQVKVIRAMYADKDADGISTEVMKYFVNLASTCSGGVGLLFRDGTLGAGVFLELERIAQAGYPIWVMTHRREISLVDIGSIPVLSVNETRARIRRTNGTRRPY